MVRSARRTSQRRSGSTSHTAVSVDEPLPLAARRHAGVRDEDRVAALELGEQPFELGQDMLVLGVERVGEGIERCVVDEHRSSGGRLPHVRATSSSRSVTASLRWRCQRSMRFHSKNEKPTIANPARASAT